MIVAGSAAAGLTVVGGGVFFGRQAYRNAAEVASLNRPHLRGIVPAPHAVLIALQRRSQNVEVRQRELRQVVFEVRAAGAHGQDAWLGLGSGLFRGRTGAPRQLTTMPGFAGDVLDPAQSHGDLLIQIAGRDGSDVRAAIEGVLRGLPGWRLRWRIEGFRAENRVKDGRGLARNPFHFADGFGNPDNRRGIADRVLVRADQGEPDWVVGGSYQVIRIVRLATELWDKDTIHEQERIIGRRRDGRWLDGTPSDEEPNFAADPKGKATPLDSHVRLAAPDRRNPPPVVRRSYSYDHGNGDTGLIFSCFQRDLAKGFEAVQKRLESEAMAKYLLTTGGGYFFIPPPGDAWIDAAFES
ncbi:Dyp-type peroxidase [Streptomyces sp. NPDC091416]|uniref:Dyp-type peroxidase n=1 Tax=Streptomyces sp. NPDC091416 TaxID=3366003 RepID=UPI0037F87F9D